MRENDVSENHNHNRTNRIKGYVHTNLNTQIIPAGA